MKKITLFLLCLFVLPIQMFAFGVESYDEKFSLTLISGTEDDLKIVYNPNEKFVFDVPSEVVIAGNTPIALNYSWVCWHDDQSNNNYYPGDKIVVDKNLVLKSVWEKKNETLLNNIVDKIGVIIKNMLEMLGYYDIEKYSLPYEEKLGENYTNNCVIVVNGKNISSEVYANIDVENNVVEVPLLAISKELGGEVVWKNNNIVTIKYNDLSVVIDTAKEDFGVTVPPGGQRVRKKIKCDLIFDIPSIRGLLKNMFDSRIFVDYDNNVITVQKMNTGDG